MNIIIYILAFIGLVTVIAGTIATVLLVQYDPTKDPSNQYYRKPVNIEGQ